MILLIVALHAEAKPFIQEYKLRRDFSVRAFEIFRGANIHLIVSGIGKVRAAAAATYLLGTLPLASTAVLASVGIAGGVRPFMKGTGYLVHKVTDAGNGKNFFPEIAVRHSFPETPLITVDRAVEASVLASLEGSEGCPLLGGKAIVDMEGAGVCEAAGRFLHCGQIALYKVVFDDLCSAVPNAGEVSDLLAPHVVPLVHHLIAMQQGLAAHETADAGTSAVEALAASLHLTAAQQATLKRAARLAPSSALSALNHCGVCPPASKAERAERYSKVLAALSNARARE